MPGHLRRGPGRLPGQLDAARRRVNDARSTRSTTKKLVTNHDAFGYYVDHYGLDFVGSVIPSFDSQAELSPQDINDLVAAKIKAEGVKAASSQRARSRPRRPEPSPTKPASGSSHGDGALYGDTLGPRRGDGDTYLKMMAHNTTDHRRQPQVRS